MKDQINTIREFFSLPVPHSPQDVGPYLVVKSKAADALGRLEAMVGSQEPVAWMNPHTGTTLSHKEKLRFLSLAGGQNYQGQNDDGMKAYAAAQTQPLYAAPVAQQYEAGDMASAAAQGFRDGAASVTQQEQKPVAWLHPANSSCVTTDPTAYARGIPLYRAAPAPQQQQYDQTALELCAVCGWKTLIPGDCCLNCERNKAQQPQADLLAAAKEFCRKVEAGEARSTKSYAAFKSAIEQIEKQPQAEKRCQYCDGTGDVHSIDGQWRGECHCQKQPQAEPDWINGVPHWSPALVAKVKQMTAELDEPKQPQVEAVPAWTTEQITAVAQPIAMAIAENCRTAPQLVFPHLFLGLKDLLTSTTLQQAEAAPVAVVKYQVGGLVVHIVGDVQEGDELFKTPQQAEAVPPDVVRRRAIREVADKLETLRTDAHFIFNNPPGEAPQAVRDVIEWYAGSIIADLDALAAQGAKT